MFLKLKNNFIKIIILITTIYIYYDYLCRNYRSIINLSNKKIRKICLIEMKYQSDF